MEERSALVLFSGTELHVSADEYAHFEANRNFFYLTGLRREHMILVMVKNGAAPKTMLFIEEADPTAVRWTGKRVSVEEAKELTGIEEIHFLDSFVGQVNRLMGGGLTTLYFDCNRYQWDDLPDYNAVKAREFAARYPGVPIRDIYPTLA